jgi:hypothetical protein
MFPEGATKPEAEKTKSTKFRALKEKSNGAGKPRAQKAKQPEKPASPLPGEAQEAPELPKTERVKSDYPKTDDDIFTDSVAGDDDDLSEEAPSVPKLVDKLPKAKYIRFRPGTENIAALYTIKLDEADQRPGEMNVYILTKEMRDYFENHLGYKVTKMLVMDVVTLQGDQFMFLTPASSELSGNSWIVTRRNMIAAGLKGWIIVRTDMKDREYKWRNRKAHLPKVEFPWPEEPIKDRARKAIDGPRLIESIYHPIVKRLEGETGDGEGDADNGED